jgi:dihydroneopterin aldolase
MGLMEVNGIRVFAYHGCLAEEARIGGHFRVDVCVQGHMERAERHDQLADAVDYGRVTAIVQEQMAQRANLIEHVARRIWEALRSEWDPSYRWTVRVVKERPPINGDVAESAYTVEG